VRVKRGHCLAVGDPVGQFEDGGGKSGNGTSHVGLGKLTGANGYPKQTDPGCDAGSSIMLQVMKK
jgi:hypothetical protein